MVSVNQCMKQQIALSAICISEKEFTFLQLSTFFKVYSFQIIVCLILHILSSFILVWEEGVTYNSLKVDFIFFSLLSDKFRMT